MFRADFLQLNEMSCPLKEVFNLWSVGSVVCKKGFNDQKCCLCFSTLANLAGKKLMISSKKIGFNIRPNYLLGDPDQAGLRVG